MKVKFERDHLDNKKGDVIEVDEARANYFKMVGIAKEHHAEKQHTKPVDTKAESPVKEKNDKAGPNAKKKTK